MNSFVFANRIASLLYRITESPKSPLPGHRSWLTCTCGVQQRPGRAFSDSGGGAAGLRDRRRVNVRRCRSPFAERCAVSRPSSTEWRAGRGLPERRAGR